MIKLTGGGPGGGGEQTPPEPSPAGPHDESGAADHGADAVAQPEPSANQCATLLVPTDPEAETKKLKSFTLAYTTAVGSAPVQPPCVVTRAISHKPVTSPKPTVIASAIYPQGSPTNNEPKLALNSPIVKSIGPATNAQKMQVCSIFRLEI